MAERDLSAWARTSPACLLMYLRYVDVSNTACNTRLVRGKVRVVEQKVEEDRQTPGDSWRLLEIANKICPFIQMTVDCPSMHPSNLMPILDLEVGV